MDSGIQGIRGSFRLLIVLLCGFACGAGIVAAQQFPVRVDINEAGSPITLPVSNVAYPAVSGGHRLIRFSGRALDAANNPVTGATGVTFAIYEEQSGGAPLWQETQNLTADASGQFSVLLGSTSETGISSEIFSSGDTRWLGVLTHSPGASEQARVLLVSVPYALRAEDSEMLGGKPASAYLTVNSQVDSQIQCSQSEATSAVTTASRMSTSPQQFLDANNGTSLLGENLIVDRSWNPSPTFNGVTFSTVASFRTSDPGNTSISFHNPTGDQAAIVTDGPIMSLENGAYFAGKVGIGTTSPQQPLDVSGAASFLGENLTIDRSWTPSPTFNGVTFSTVASFRTSDPGNTSISFHNPTADQTAIVTDGPIMSLENGAYFAGKVGIGTTNPDRLLTVNGAIHSTSGGFVFPDGSVMTTAATSSGSQVQGSNLVLPAGSGTNGAGNLELQTANTSTSTAIDRLLIAGTPKTMSGTVPTANLFSLHIASGDAAGGRVKFTIVASDGTHYAMETGEMIYLANPTQLTCAVVVSQFAQAPASYTNTMLAVPAAGQSGFLNAQCNYATFGSDPGVQIFDTAPTSFTPTTHKVYYTIENQSQTPITLQP
ncbi:MAG TPA: hypothetical protein VM578_01370 [Candidatus Saccharimonadales bacterium]|nr:hypothetical protein [Candidatus Saccharimonadales bacterium]